MKYLNGMLAFVLSILVFSLNAMAQESSFTEDDLKILQQNAAQKLKDKTYRLTTTSVTFENENPTPVRTEKTIYETIPPDRTRVMTKIKTANDIKQSEYIRIGDRFFTRSNNGEWKESGIGQGSGIGSGSGGGQGTQVKVETFTERKLKKGEIINNQTVDYYETITTTKFILLTKTYTNIRKSGYWFDANGRYVKAETEFQNGSEKGVSRTTREYEYDPNIKIEAPIK